MLFESDKSELEVHLPGKNERTIAKFIDGKFETNDKKTIEILQTIEGVEEVDLSKCTDAYDILDPEENADKDETKTRKVKTWKD